MEKRYQVFVSSTFEDLREERQEVIMALLELDCIPYGMELFPATDEDQWTFIQRAINDCDYYIVIVGGRYGSLGPGGKSFTQLEYEYAINAGKPTIAFLHGEPGKLAAERVESTDEGKRKLADFKELLKQKLYKPWASPGDLRGQVTISMVQLTKRHPAIGWVRANLVADESAAQEMNNLRRKIERLERELEEVRAKPIIEVDGLANLDDNFELVFRIADGQGKNFKKVMSWKDIFICIGSKMLAKAESEIGLEKALASSTQNDNCYLYSPKIARLLLHLEALALISPEQMATQIATWKLTQYGRQTLLKTGAYRQPEDA